MGDLAQPHICDEPRVRVVCPAETRLFFRRGAKIWHLAFFADCHGRDKLVKVRFSDRQDFRLDRDAPLPTARVQR